MSDPADLTIRSDERTAEFARRIGNAAVLLILDTRLLELQAEGFAGVDDEECFLCLLEAAYRLGILGDYIDAMTLIELEAAKL